MNAQIQGSGDYLQLTTPELKEYDSVFPGENWFLYWKTSPSLWSSKLREYQTEGPIFVPIYWGLHNEHPEQYDFGTYKPETDLAKLALIAKELDKRIVALLPVGPSPFLTNGGLPTFLTRVLSHTKEGLALAVVDSEKRLNKVYSMFDPKVFQSYRKFTWNFGQYLTRKGIDWEVYGGHYGHLENEEFHSYLRDYSPVFEQGFTRYINQLKNSEPQKIEELQDNLDYENILKEEFFDQIQSLYVQAAEEAVSASWGGVLNFAFLGGRGHDIFSRTSELWEHENNFFKTFFETLTHSLIPSSVLLGPEFKKGVLQKCINDQVNLNVIHKALDAMVYDENKMGLSPMVFFHIFKKEKSKQITTLAKKIGLLNFIYRDYRWTQRYLDTIDLEEHELSNKIFFFFSKDLNLDDFNNVIKLFMNGCKVVLDTNEMEPEINKRMNQFLNENDFKSEVVKFKATIKRVTLGEGQLVLLDHGPLNEFNTIQKVSFWNSLVSFLSIKHLKFDAPEDIFYFWKSRASNTYELNYEEIRRLSLYNPTSYKKKIQINASNNFAFLKSVDQIRCDVKTSPVGINIELMPGGSISVDFGYYE